MATASTSRLGRRRTRRGAGRPRCPLRRPSLLCARAARRFCGRARGALRTRGRVRLGASWREGNRGLRRSWREGGCRAGRADPLRLLSVRAPRGVVGGVFTHRWTAPGGEQLVAEFCLDCVSALARSGSSRRKAELERIHRKVEASLAESP